MSEMCESSRECAKNRDAHSEGIRAAMNCDQRKSKWDEVGALFEEISTLRGGPEKLYKPVISIEYYEHDECWTVKVGRCKGLDDIAAEVNDYDPPPIPHGGCADQLLEMLKRVRAKLGACE